MESNDRGKRKGFANGKRVMMSFRRTTSKQQHPASGSTTTTTSSGKVKPSQQGGSGNLHHHLLNTTGQPKQRILQPSSSDRINVNQSQRLPPPSRSTSRSTSDAASSVEFILNQENVTPRVSILLQDTCANVDSFYSTVAEDESVDIKATSYISNVRERLRV